MDPGPLGRMEARRPPSLCVRSSEPRGVLLPPQLMGSHLTEEEAEDQAGGTHRGPQGGLQDCSSFPECSVPGADWSRSGGSRLSQGVPLHPPAGLIGYHGFQAHERQLWLLAS